MNLLKRIPIKYIGELHDIRLINFSIDKCELENKIPEKIRIRNFNGRALISMVDVKLKKMHPEFLPEVFNFNYRHVAFRLLIDDSIYNQGVQKGIFFFKSFTDNPIIVAGGKYLTDYNLEIATIEEDNGKVFVRKGNNHIQYSIGNDIIEEGEKLNQLRLTIGAIDRAYCFR